MKAGDLTLTGLRDAIAGKKISATEATQAYLQRIDGCNDGLNAYREIWREPALAQAAAVDAGKATGPLAGVPIAVKDVLCTELGTTSCGSRMLEGYRSPFTATAVKRLQEAGAVLLGKTNMDEFAMGSSNETCYYGPVRNPWHRDCVPGGSSGGAAAAMAADLCAGSLGTDTGGSIRQPAAFCGVVGFKPTYGRISRWGLVAFASSLDQIGPFTRDVADAALLYSVMAGHDPLDATCADLPVDPGTLQVDQPPTPLRVGLPREYFSDANHPAVAAALQKAMDVLRDAGAQLVEVDLPHTRYGIPTYYIVATAEASSNLARYDGVHYGHRARQASELMDMVCHSRAEGFGDEVQRRIMLGTYALSSGYYDAYYLRALKVRRLIKQDFDAAFTACDVLLCPTTTHPAFGFGEKSDDPLAMYMNDVYTVNANLAGTPGISLPADVVSENGRTLPVGVQLLGQAFDETRLLQAARLLEKGLGFTARPALDH